MRKITGLLLVLTLFVFGGLYFSNGVLAAGDETIDVTVIKGDELVPNIKYQGTLGSEANVDIESLVTEGYEFAYYIHNGEIISDMNAKFIVSKSNNIIVVIQETESPVIVYIDTNGKLLGFNQEPTNPPTKPGMTFNKYVNHKDTANVKVASYTITKTDDVLLNISGGQADVGTPKYNEVVELTPTIENFSYWADKDGQIVSTNPNYKFTAILPNGETEIKLVAVSEEGFVAEPSVYLTNVTGIREGYNSFLGYINNIEGFELVEYGIIASSDAKVLSLDSTNATIMPSTSLSLTNEFLRTIQEGEFVSFRAYAVFKDFEGQIIKYSDNNYTYSNANLTHSFDFSDPNHGNSYKDGNVFNFEYKNLVDDSLFNIEFLRVANNDNAGLEKALIISPRGNQGNGIAYVDFEFNDFNVNKIVFDIQYWNDKAEQYFESLVIQKWDGTEWVDVKDLLPIITEKTTLVENVEVNINATRFRIYATGGQSDGNTARVMVDNLKVYNSIITKMYSVDFINDENILATSSVIAGDKVNTFTPELDWGYSFEGWYTSLTYQNLFDFNTPINSHIKLYAKIVEVPKYTVTFDLAGAEGGSAYNPQTILQNDVVIKPIDPQKEDYVFVGWYLNNQEFDFETPITENITLVAKWEDASQMMNVTFMDGEEEYLVIPVVSGAKVEKPEDPVKEGFEFVAWQLDGVDFDFDTVIEEDIILVAKWEEVQEAETETVTLLASESGYPTSYNNFTWSFGTVSFSGVKLTRGGSGAEYTIQGNKKYSSSITSTDLGLIHEIKIRNANTGSNAVASAKFYVEVSSTSDFSNSTRYSFGSGYSNDTNITISSAGATVSNVFTNSHKNAVITINVLGDNASYVRFVWENGATYIAQIDVVFSPQA